MNEQRPATDQDIQNDLSSDASSLERRRESYKWNGIICLALMLAVGFINGAQIVTGAFVDTVQTGLLIGAIVCFVAAARVKIAK